MPFDPRMLPVKASRRWGRYRVLHEATVYSEDGVVEWVCPPDQVLVCLIGRDDPARQVAVPVPEVGLNSVDFDIWAWVMPRANRAHRAGKMLAPVARRWPPASLVRAREAAQREFEESA